MDEEQAFSDAERTIDDVLDEALAGPLSNATSRLLDACFGLDRARNEITVLLGRPRRRGAPRRRARHRNHVADAERNLAQLRALCVGIATAEPSALSDPARAALNALNAPDLISLRAALGDIASVRSTKTLKAPALLAGLRGIPSWPLRQQQA